MSNSVVHRMFFNKNNKIWNDFNFKMLFEWYSHRARYSKKMKLMRIILFKSNIIKAYLLSSQEKY